MDKYLYGMTNWLTHPALPALSSKDKTLVHGIINYIKDTTGSQTQLVNHALNQNLKLTQDVVTNLIYTTSPKTEDLTIVPSNPISSNPLLSPAKKSSSNPFLSSVRNESSNPFLSPAQNASSNPFIPFKPTTITLPLVENNFNVIDIQQCNNISIRSPVEDTEILFENEFFSKVNSSNTYPLNHANPSSSEKILQSLNYSHPNLQTPNKKLSKIRKYQQKIVNKGYKPTYLEEPLELVPEFDKYLMQPPGKIRICDYEDAEPSYKMVEIRSNS